MDQSLRELFDRALSDEPPAPPGDLAAEAMTGGRSRRRRRQLLAGGVAGVATVLATVVAVTVLSTPPATPLAMSLAARPKCSQDAVPPVEISIFLRDGVTDKQIAVLDASLRSDPRVRQVRYDSREVAYERFKEMYRDAPDLVAAIKPGQLPAAFRVTLTQRSGHLGLMEDVRRRPGVETVAGASCVLPGEGE